MCICTSIYNVILSKGEENYDLQNTTLSFLIDKMVIPRHPEQKDCWEIKEIEETNRMGKTRDLLKKIRDTKGTFHAKMGSIKDRSGMNLTEAEDIKKRWQEYTEELYKNDLHDLDNHDGVITHAKPDILDNAKSSGP